jgi:hypothetical protein
MAKVREVVDAIVNPIRRNELKARRRKLGLSLVALGRILEVDPATVFRHERGPLVALWDYALRGIEAEAAHKSSKDEIRSFRSGLDHQIFWPEQLAARGYSYVAEKMHQDRLKHAQRKSRSAPSPSAEKPSALRPSSGVYNARRKEQLSKAAIKQIADRAERKD